MKEGRVHKKIITNVAPSTSCFALGARMDFVGKSDGRALLFAEIVQQLQLLGRMTVEQDGTPHLRRLVAL